MRNIFLACFFLIIDLYSYSQDTIRFKTNDVRAVKVSEIGIDEVKYHRFDNLDGPQYIANKSDITYIKYQNGHVDTFKVAARVETPSVSSASSSVPLISIRGNKLVYAGRGLGDSRLLKLINNYPYQQTKSKLLADFREYKKYKRNQYILGFVGLGVGVLAPYFGMVASVISTDPYTGEADFTPFAVGVVIGATVGITGGVISSVCKHKRNAKKKDMARIYNEMK